MAKIRKILIIEDEPEIRKILKKILIEEAYKVYVTGKGKEGLAKIREYHPELVIIDLKLPDIAGKEVVSGIRSINKKVKIIIITAFGTMDTKKELNELGISDFIEKPFRLERILKSVRKVLAEELPVRNAADQL